MAEKSQVDFEEELLNRFRASARPSKLTGVDTEVFIVPCGRENFVNRQLQELRESGHGIFSRLKHQKFDYFEYQCERYSRPRGRSSGLSTQTRANCCAAIVSFKFVDHGHVTGCIRRLRSKHNGHDPSSQSEKCVGLIDKTVTCIVETLAFNGKKPSDIMRALKLWAKEQGHRDINDRRFHPKLQDISNMLKSYRKHLRFHSDDVLCMEKLLQGDLCFSCLSYHPLDLDADQSVLSTVVLETESREHSRFHVVLQSPEQAVLLEREARECVLAFITMCGKEENRPGKRSEHQQRMFSACIVSILSQDAVFSIPVAAVITELDGKEALEAGLLALRENHPHFYPSAFMTEGDTLLTECVNHVWPESVVLWAWSSVLQAASEWTSCYWKYVRSKDGAHFRSVVLRSLWRLKLCTTKRQFNLKAKMLPEKMDKITSLSSQAKKRCQTYLETEWISSAEQWSDYGRQFLVAQWLKPPVHLDALDRIFLKQQLQFSSCGSCQKLDFLILMLHHCVNLFFNAFHTLSPQLCQSHRQADTSADATSQSSQRLPQTDQHCKESTKLEDTETLAKSVSEECFASHEDGNKQQCFVVSDAEHLTTCSSRLNTENALQRKEPCPSGHVSMNLKDPGHIFSRKQVGQGEEFDRAVWLNEGTCILPSDKSLFVSWKVDYVAMVCSCPEALMSGTCRHLQVEPAERQAKVAKLRQSLANDIVSKGSFHHKANRFYILCAKCYLYTVYMLGQADDHDDPDLQQAIDTPPATGSHHPVSEPSLWDCMKQALTEAGFTKCSVRSAKVKDTHPPYNSLRNNKMESNKQSHSVFATDSKEVEPQTEEVVEEKEVEIIHADECKSNCEIGSNKYSYEMNADVNDHVTSNDCSVSTCAVTMNKMSEEITGFTNGDVGFRNCTSASNAAVTDHTTVEINGHVNRAIGIKNDVNGGISSDAAVDVVNAEYSVNATNDGTIDYLNSVTNAAGKIVEDGCKVANNTKTGNTMSGLVAMTTGAVEEVMTVGMSSVTPSQLLLSLSVPLPNLLPAAPTSTLVTSKVLQHQGKSSLHLSTKIQEFGPPESEPHSLPEHVKKDHRDGAKVAVTLPSTAGSIPCPEILTRTYSTEDCTDTCSENDPVSVNISTEGTADVKLQCAESEFMGRSNGGASTSLHETPTTESECLRVSSQQTSLMPDQKRSLCIVEALKVEAASQRLSSLPTVSQAILNIAGDERLSELSTRTMIEELATWTQSKNFTDSAGLRAAVISVYRTALSSNSGRHGNTLMEVSSMTNEEPRLDDALHAVCQSSNIGCEMVEQRRGHTQEVKLTTSTTAGTRPHEVLACQCVDLKSIALQTPSQLITSYSQLQTSQQKVSTSVHTTEYQEILNQQKQSQAEGDPSCQSLSDMNQVTANSNACLDDLVRRLEARQQLAAEDIGCLLPSPSKKMKIQPQGEGVTLTPVTSPSTKKTKTTQNREECSAHVSPSANTRPESPQQDENSTCSSAVYRAPGVPTSREASFAAGVAETEKTHQTLEAHLLGRSGDTLQAGGWAKQQLQDPQEADLQELEETGEVCLPVAGLTLAGPETSDADSSEVNSVTYIVQSDSEDRDGSVIYIVTV